MKEQLIEYGFIDTENNFLEYKKNEWEFHYNPSKNYAWVYTPNGGEEDGICLHNLTYEKIIKLIEFISEY